MAKIKKPADLAVARIRDEVNAAMSAAFSYLF